jgi:hypothetical protein
MRKIQVSFSSCPGTVVKNEQTQKYEGRCYFLRKEIRRHNVPNNTTVAQCCTHVPFEVVTLFQLCIKRVCEYWGVTVSEATTESNAIETNRVGDYMSTV